MKNIAKNKWSHLRKFMACLGRGRYWLGSWDLSDFFYWFCSKRIRRVECREPTYPSYLFMRIWGFPLKSDKYVSSNMISEKKQKQNYLVELLFPCLIKTNLKISLNNKLYITNIKSDILGHNWELKINSPDSGNLLSVYLILKFKVRFRFVQKLLL